MKDLIKILTAVFITAWAVSAADTVNTWNYGRNPFEYDVVVTLFDNDSLHIKGTNYMSEGFNSPYTIPWRDYNGTIKKVVIEDGVKSIPRYAFYNVFDAPSSITSVTIGDSVESIGAYAFLGCINLTSIIIPNSVKDIGESAFDGCDLKSITIPSNVENIGMTAFANAGLNKVIIEDGVEKIIGEHAFSGGNNIKEVYIGSIGNLGDSLFAFHRNLSALEISLGTALGKGTFYNCSLTVLTLNADTLSGKTEIKNTWKDISTYLQTVIIKQGVTAIGDSAFAGFSNLTFVDIPNSVTSIGKSAFSNCKNLTSIIISDSVKSIEDNTFSGCYNLKEVIIPNSVTSIGDMAFRNCDSFTSITIPNNVTSIGYEAFANCDNLKEVTIEDGVKSIGEKAFWECYSLTEVNIPNSVTSIGVEAFFANINLTSITLPESLTDLGANSLGHCNKLEAIVISAPTPPAVEEHAFIFLEKSKITLYVPKNSIELYKAADGWKTFFNIRDIADYVPPTSINKVQKSDNRYGIRFAQSIVSDKAEISVVLPNNEKATQTKLAVYDAIGNIVFETTTRENENIVWNLTNSAGRTVANGTYLVIAEVKGQNGMNYYYSAKLGVRR